MKEQQLVLEVDRLRKTFGQVTAVEEISTTLEMIERLQSPDSGTILLFGKTWNGDTEHIKRPF